MRHLPLGKCRDLDGRVRELQPLQLLKLRNGGQRLIIELFSFQGYGNYPAMEHHLIAIQDSSQPIRTNRADRHAGRKMRWSRKRKYPFRTRPIEWRGKGQKLLNPI